MVRNAVTLIECPRDAWQGLSSQIPTELKVRYLRGLINAGFKHIDAVSFVSPKAVPQMADSEKVLQQIDLPNDVEIIGIVVNEKGAERAIHAAARRGAGSRPAPQGNYFKWELASWSRVLFRRKLEDVAAMDLPQHRPDKP